MLPVKYVGLPLSMSYPATKQYAPLIDKIRAKINSWQFKTLSASGRAELIRSVLHNIATGLPLSECQLL